MRYLVLLFLTFFIIFTNAKSFDMKVHFTDDTNVNIHSESIVKFIFEPKDDPTELILIYDDSLKAIKLNEINKITFSEENETSLLFYSNDSDMKKINTSELKEIWVNPKVSVDSDIDLANDLQVYPIPAQDYIEISFNNENNAVGLIRIFDLSGTEVFNASINNDSFKWDLKINESKVNSGVYYIVLELNKELYTKKFVIL